MSNNYGAIGQCLVNHHNKAYRSIMKIKDSSEARPYKEILDDSRVAMKLFNELLHEVAIKYGLVDFKNREFLDGSKRKVRPYYWGQMKYVTLMNSAESIAMFCEILPNDSYRYRLSLEIHEDQATQEELQNHLRLLDKPLSSERLVYLVNETAAKDLVEVKKASEQIRTDLSKGKYKKVQIAYIVKNPHSDEALVSELQNGVGLLLPYYNYVMGV